MFKPIPVKRAYENIVLRIERAITEGQLQIDDQLPSERELAEEFGVSRVVIREAIRNLEARRVVEVRHGSGTYIKAVPDPTIEQSLTLMLKLEEASLLDLYVVRQALELVSAPRAAQYATPEEVQTLRQCLEDLLSLSKDASDSEEAYLAFIDKDTDFHHLMAEASHNLPLVTLLEAVLPLMNLGRLEIIRQANVSDKEGWKTLHSRHQPEQITEELTNIFNAIASHDPKAAEHFIYLHLQHAIAGFHDL